MGEKEQEADNRPFSSPCLQPPLHHLCLHYSVTLLPISFCPHLAGLTGLTPSAGLHLPIYNMKEQLHVPIHCSPRMATDSYDVSWATSTFTACKLNPWLCNQFSGNKWWFCAPCLALAPSSFPPPSPSSVALCSSPSPSSLHPTSSANSALNTQYSVLPFAYPQHESTALCSQPLQSHNGYQYCILSSFKFCCLSTRSLIV